MNRKGHKIALELVSFEHNQSILGLHFDWCEKYVLTIFETSLKIFGGSLFES